MSRVRNDPDGPDPVPSSSDDANKTSAPALKRFRFPSSKLMAQEPSALTHNADTAATQIARYTSEAAEADDVNGLDFWSSRKTTYSSIVPLAEDLLAAPASQAFVERVFSLCGLLTSGRRNRMSKS